MVVFTDIWAGKFPLWKSFWMYGFGGAVLFGFADQIFGGGPLGMFVAAVAVPYFSIVFVGVWRSATNYTGEHLWPVLAKFVAIIKLMQVVGVVIALTGLASS